MYVQEGSGGTADPSAYPDDKGKGSAFLGILYCTSEPQVPTLRSGRDDNSVVTLTFLTINALFIPPSTCHGQVKLLLMKQSGGLGP
jgi:hypothetical protein